MFSSIGSRIRIGSRTTLPSETPPPMSSQSQEQMVKDQVVQEVSSKVLEGSPSGSPSSIPVKDLSPSLQLTEVSLAENPQRTIEEISKDFFNTLVDICSNRILPDQVNGELALSLQQAPLIYARESPGGSTKSIARWNEKCHKLDDELKQQNVTQTQFSIELLKALAKYTIQKPAQSVLIPLTNKLWGKKEILGKLDTSTALIFCKTFEKEKALVYALETISDNPDFFPEGLSFLVKVVEKMGGLYEVKGDHDLLFKKFNALTEKIAPKLNINDYFGKLIKVGPRPPYDFLCEHFTLILSGKNKGKLDDELCSRFISAAIWALKDDPKKLSDVLTLAHLMESRSTKKAYNFKDLIVGLRASVAHPNFHIHFNFLCDMAIEKLKSGRNYMDKEIEKIFPEFCVLAISAIKNDPEKFCRLLTLINLMESVFNKSMCALKALRQGLEPTLLSKQLSLPEIKLLALTFVKFSQPYTTTAFSDYTVLNDYFSQEIFKRTSFETFLTELLKVDCSPRFVKVDCSTQLRQEDSSSRFLCDKFIDLCKPQLDNLLLEDHPVTFINKALIEMADEPKTLMNILKFAFKIQPSQSAVERQEFWNKLLIPQCMIHLINQAEEGNFNEVPDLLRLVEPILLFCDPRLLGSLCQKPAHFRFFANLFAAQVTIPANFANHWTRAVLNTYGEGDDIKALVCLMNIRKSLYEKSEQRPFEFWSLDMDEILLDNCRKFQQADGVMHPKVEAQYEDYLYTILESYKNTAVPETVKEIFNSKRLIDQCFFCTHLKKYILNKMDRVNQKQMVNERGWGKDLAKIPYRVLEASGDRYSVVGLRQILSAILTSRPTQIDNDYNQCANALAVHYPHEALELLKQSLPKRLPKGYDAPNFLRALTTVVENCPEEDIEIVSAILAREDVIASGQQLPEWRVLWTKVLLEMLNYLDKDEALKFFQTHGTKSHEGFVFWRNAASTHFKDEPEVCKEWESTLESIYSVSEGTKRAMETMSADKIKPTMHEDIKESSLRTSTEGASSPTLRAPEKMTQANSTPVIPVY